MEPGNTVEMLTEDEKAFLIAVATHPNQASKRIYSRAVFSPSRGARIKNSLVKRRLIGIEKGLTGRKIHFLSITPKGLWALGEEIPNTREQGEMVLMENEDGGNPNCQHYWVIDSPMGPTSPGVCRICGGKRNFKNFLNVPDLTFA